MTKITLELPENFFVKVAGESYSVTSKDFHKDAIMHCLKNGVQRFVNDATGGKDKTPEDKAAIAKKQIEKLIAETFETHTRTNSGEPAIYRFVRVIMRKLVDADEYKAIDADDKAAWLIEQYEDLNDDKTKIVDDNATKLQEMDKAEKALIASLAS